MLLHACAQSRIRSITTIVSCGTLSFRVPNIQQPLLSRVPPNKGHNVDNHAYVVPCVLGQARYGAQRKRSGG